MRSGIRGEEQWTFQWEYKGMHIPLPDIETAGKNMQGVSEHQST